MGITESIKHGFSYATSDYQKLLIFGIICILASLSSVVTGFGIKNNESLFAIIGIIAFIFSIITGGYGLGILKKNVEGASDLPDLNIKNNFIDGIKFIVLEIVYYIIPIIITLIIGIITLGASISSLGTEALNSTVNETALLNPAFLGTFLTGLGITIIIGIILFIIFTFFELMGVSRLAKTGSLSEGLSFRQSYADAKSIGFGPLLGWIILIGIILFIIAIIGSLITLIPYVGALITALVITPFSIIFANASLGNLYKTDVLKE
ncbi:DUF4013 domain-containing protein [Methanobrevibacter boviskoreani]|uniref:DUF4013 domain-containing protein n=1 Tax=Methanobrevibacter boviskoreani TaxID=1348249 RepID=UPI000593DEA9|nr:DUF4013 domain-containing protein [Methanobrevibacter boviskoreani]